jgi:hypothetical protein
MNEVGRGEQDLSVDAEAPQPLNLLDSTAVYLRDKALDSFGQFNELDESVWRSLPFFAVVFGFAATLVAAAVDLLPIFRPLIT